MNASQRRQFRRAIVKATGLTAGQAITRNGTQARVLHVMQNGKREVMVKRRDNRAVCWPLGECALPI